MKPCPKCDGKMEKGRIQAAGVPPSGEGLLGPRVLFVTGEVTLNPIKAFKQGLTGESADFKIVGARCSACGFLELYAEK